MKSDARRMSAKRFSPTTPRPGLLIIVGSFDGRGGLQIRLLDLAMSFARDRPVTVLTWRVRVRPRIEIRSTGIRVVVVPSLLDWGRDHHPLPAALNTGFSLMSGVAAAVLLRRRWSVAYAAGLHPEGTVAAVASGRRRRFVVNTWLTGPLGNAQRLRRSVAREVVLYLLRGAHRFLPQAPTGAEELIGLKLPSERVTVLETGVDLRRFSVARGRHRGGNSAPNVAVYAGRFDLRQKKLDLLLDAWRAAALDGWELVLAGAGNDEEAVHHEAASQQSVRVLGWHADVLCLLASADLFVLPTIAEERPKSMLQGMACGLPGIVSAIPGIIELEPEGVLMVDNDLSGWVSGLQAVDALGSTGRDAAGQRARAWAESNADGEREIARLRRLLA